MAFLLRDQNQGQRNNGAHANPREAPQPFSFIRTLTVGFGIAPNLLTHFSHETFREEGARGLGLSALPAGGDFHPALRTSAAPHGQPWGNYDGSPGPGQAALAWRISMAPRAKIEAPGRRRTVKRGAKKLRKCKHSNSADALVRN